MAITAVDEARARRELPSPEMRRAIRKSAGLSLRRMAGDLEVSGQALAYWETGARTPRPENVVRYADLLRSLEDVAR
jgi:transcriptional regulator with XRE-family HTH domain